MIRQAGVIGAGILAVAFTLVAHARAEMGTPTETLREVFTGVNKALAGPMEGDQMARRVLDVRALLNRALDFRNAAVRALGDEWPARTATEQDAFIDLFADFLERSCVAQMASVADRKNGIRIHYLTEVITGDRAMVGTSIETKGGGEMLFDFAMVRHEGQWMIRDVVIEDVSLIGNIRSQFKRVMRDSSYSGLVIRMKARTAEPPPARAATAVVSPLTPGVRSPMKDSP